MPGNHFMGAAQAATGGREPGTRRRKGKRRRGKRAKKRAAPSNAFLDVVGSARK